MENKKNISIKEALVKSKRICSIKETCVSDIKEKLFAWGIERKKFEEIIHELVNKNFINEERYARFYTRDKYRINKWGRNKIKYQLILKQIPEKIIQKASYEIDEIVYERILTDIIEKKNKTIKAKNNYEIVSKLIKYATSRGYEYDMVYKVIQKIIK